METNKYFFEVKPGSKMYIDYFSFEADKKKVISAFNKVKAEFGIETNEFCMGKNCLIINPTEKDKSTFKGILTVNGAFRKNSKVGKMWKDLVKDVEHFSKPTMYNYIYFSCRRWQERLFHVEDRLYGSIEFDGIGTIHEPDFVVPLKASEFYKIVEDAETCGKME